MEDGSEGRRGHVDVLSDWSSSANDQLAQELCAGRRVGSKNLGPSVWYCSAVMFLLCAGENRDGAGNFHLWGPEVQGL